MISIRRAKGRLSACKRRQNATQKAAFHRVKGRLLQYMPPRAETPPEALQGAAEGATNYKFKNFEQPDLQFLSLIRIFATDFK